MKIINKVFVPILTYMSLTINKIIIINLTCISLGFCLDNDIPDTSLPRLYSISQLIDVLASNTPRDTRFMLPPLPQDIPPFSATFPAHLGQIDRQGFLCSLWSTTLISKKVNADEKELYLKTGKPSQSKKRRFSKNTKSSTSLSQDTVVEAPEAPQKHISNASQSLDSKEHELKECLTSDMPIYDKALFLRQYIRANRHLSQRRIGRIIRCSQSKICEYQQIANFPLDFKKELNAWDKVSFRTFKKIVKFASNNPENLALLPTLFKYLNSKDMESKDKDKEKELLNDTIQKFLNKPDISILKEDVTQ